MIVEIVAIGILSLILTYSTFTKERTVNISLACRVLIAEIGTVTTEIDSPIALKTSKIAISPQYVGVRSYSGIHEQAK